MFFDLLHYFDAVSHFFLKMFSSPLKSMTTWLLLFLLPPLLLDVFFAGTSSMSLPSLGSIISLLFFLYALPCLFPSILVTLLLSVVLIQTPLLISRPILPTAYSICLSGPQSQISKIEFNIFLNPKL